MCLAKNCTTVVSIPLLTSLCAFVLSSQISSTPWNKGKREWAAEFYVFDKLFLHFFQFCSNWNQRRWNEHWQYMASIWWLLRLFLNVMLSLRTRYMRLIRNISSFNSLGHFRSVHKGNSINMSVCYSFEYADGVLRKSKQTSKIRY